jgi:uncharacterized protein YybS (DUF2232 family)
MIISDVMGCAAAAALLLMASAWVPIVGPVIGLFTPLPFLYYASKLGTRSGAKTVALTLLFLGLAADTAGHGRMIFFLLEFGLLGFFMSEVYRRGLTFGSTIFFSTSFALLVSAVILYLMGVYHQTGPVELVISSLRRNIESAIQAYDQVGLVEGQVDQLHEYARLLTELISRIYPALLIIGTGLVVWMNVVVSRAVFRIGKLDYPGFGPQDRWRAPEHLVWGFIASGFFLFLPSGTVKLLAVNSLIVISMIYVFHGVAIALFYMKKYNVPAWLRWIFYLMAAVQQLFVLPLFLAGLFDQWIDFRRIFKKARVDP